MQTTRSTAILTLTIPGIDLTGALGIDPQQPYRFSLRIDGKACNGGQFHIPFGDKTWREFKDALSKSTAGAGDDTLYRTVQSAGKALYDKLCASSIELATFLASGKGPRRLVIESERPEIHQLPWEAMVDKDWCSIANADISVVRCRSDFNREPDLCRSPLCVRAMFGPGTEKQTASALNRLKQSAARYTKPKLLVSTVTEQSLPGNWSDDNEEVIHIEAHGDAERGGIMLGEEKAVSDALVKRVQKRKMILLWSCYSSMIQPWGKSLASEFHNSQNTFVLSFATELQYDSSSDIANNFYPSIFRPRDAIDPESAVVKQRERLFRDYGQRGDWASMTVWMRQPLDLSAAVLDGPRLPVREWETERSGEDTGQPTASSLKLKKTVSEKAVPGRPVLIPNTIIEGPLPYSLVETYSGAVVHLRGRNGLQDESLFKALNIDTSQISSVHPADWFLSLLEALKTYSRSLLIWSDVTECEIQVVELMSELPGNLDIVFVSQKYPNVGPSVVVNSETETQTADKQRVAVQTETDGLAALEAFEESGQYRAAVTQFEQLEPDVKNWPRNRQVTYYCKGYWSFIRLHKRADAEKCVAAVEGLDRSEGQLLRGNLLHRNADFDKARTAYADLAENGENATLKGRARLELAYLAHELGDHRLAEKYFIEAIKTLESVKDNAGDPLWRSALGRGLRDYADLLVADFSSVAECATALRRSLAIHALDDRSSQIATALQTRGKLERKRAKDERGEEKAEADFRVAAALLIKSGNQVGWARAMREMAQHSFEKGRYPQALAILRHAYSQLEKYPNDLEMEKGLISLQAARIFWRQGELLEANRWSNQALLMLPNAMSQQRVEATNLQELTASLIGSSTAIH